MSLVKDDKSWLKRGRQRAAVAQVLCKPMTKTQICTAARRVAPRIQLRDVWHLLASMRQEGLVACLNPNALTGKVYALTSKGRRAVAASFGAQSLPPAKEVDWQCYGWVVRGRVRRMVLLELTRPWAMGGGTASEIRRRLRDHYPVGLNPTVRALKELVQAKLVKAEQDGRSRRRKRYMLTRQGAAIAQQLQT